MNRTLIGLLAAAAATATGCTARRDAPLSAAPAPIRHAGFRAELQEIGLVAKRMFNFGGHRGSYSQPAVLTVSVALDDDDVGRICRVRRTSGIRSIVDDRRRELIAPEVGGAGVQQVPDDFLVPTQQLNRSGARSLLVNVPVRTLPARLSRVAGSFELEVVTHEEHLVFQLPGVESAVELEHGLTATVKLCETDAASGAPKQLVLELTSPLPGDPGAAATPVIYSAELVDEAGLSVAMLQRQEEYAVGPVVRRRFAMDRTVRYDRPPATQRPASNVRLRLFTRTEGVTIPFEWGPIDLVAETESE